MSQMPAPYATPRTLPALAEEPLRRVREFERELLKHPQVLSKVRHAFHAGVYARSMLLPQGMVLTGALMKIPTLLIVSGELQVFNGEHAERFSGYNVIRGAAGRKALMLAITDVNMTMLFATQAATVDEAEREFTDEYESLQSRKGVSP